MNFSESTCQRDPKINFGTVYKSSAQDRRVAALQDKVQELESHCSLEHVAKLHEMIDALVLERANKTTAGTGGLGRKESPLDQLQETIRPKKGCLPSSSPRIHLQGASGVPKKEHPDLTKKWVGFERKGPVPKAAHMR